MTIGFDHLIVADKSSFSRVVGIEVHLKQVRERREGEMEKKEWISFEQSSIVKNSRAMNGEEAGEGNETKGGF